MTEPATLALVVKEGMLQRLSDSEDSIIDDWSVRVFQSEKPLVVTGSATSYSDKPLYSEPAYGYHQIVVASPEHNQSLSHISVEQWGNVLVVIQDRVRWLYTQKGVTYVSIYVNSGASAGAQVTHPHLNIVTFSSIPPVIDMEAEGSHRFMNENGSCPACEASSELNQAVRARFLLLTILLPFVLGLLLTRMNSGSIQRHITSFSKITQKEINDLALMLRDYTWWHVKGAQRCSIQSCIPPVAGEEEQPLIHWHIEVYPQMNTWSGLERGFGVFINNVRPEKSAEILGSSCRKELAGLVGII